MNLASLTRERNKLHRDAYFHGLKRDVYERLSVRYFLEQYKHPMVTRLYLKNLLTQEIDCPFLIDVIEHIEPLRVSKRVLYIFIKRTNVDFGIDINALPSKKWLIAALNGISAQHPLIVLLKLKADIIERILNSEGQEREEEILSYGEVLDELRRKSREWEIEIRAEWNTAIKEEMIVKLDHLLEDYHFLLLKRELHDLLN